MPVDLFSPPLEYRTHASLLITLWPHGPDLPGPQDRPRISAVENTSSTPCILPDYAPVVKNLFPDHRISPQPAGRRVDKGLKPLVHSLGTRAPCAGCLARVLPPTTLTCILPRLE